MDNNPPVGVALLSGTLGALGHAALVVNSLSIVFSWDKVSLPVELFGLVYGAVAVFAAIQLWRRLRFARAAFLAWAGLVLSSVAMIAAHVEQPELLVLPAAFLASLFYVCQRYVAKQVAPAAQQSVEPDVE